MLFEIINYAVKITKSSSKFKSIESIILEKNKSKVWHLKTNSVNLRILIKTSQFKCYYFSRDINQIYTEHNPTN